VITAIIFWIIVGLIAGALAKLIMPGDDPGGIIVTMLIGIAGAFIGGFLANLIGLGGAGGWIWSIIIATIGAIILLAIYRVIVGRRTASR
jgi:uncharacterized membrane protein YeaQ/YmgE (transglycosylase-associated protein family)